MPDLIGDKTLYVGFCGLIDSVGVGKIAGAFNQAVNDQFDAVHLTFTSPGGAASDGVFFVNIRFMFNGDRLAFVKTYHLKDANRQQELPLVVMSEEVAKSTAE